MYKVSDVTGLKTKVYKIVLTVDYGDNDCAIIQNYVDENDTYICDNMDYYYCQEEKLEENLKRIKDKINKGLTPCVTNLSW